MPDCNVEVVAKRFGAFGKHETLEDHIEIKPETPQNDDSVDEGFLVALDTQASEGLSRPTPENRTPTATPAH